MHAAGNQKRTPEEIIREEERGVKKDRAKERTSRVRRKTLKKNKRANSSAAGV